MDVAFVIRQRLAELGYEQRELARAAEVTESYISQLLTRKKVPPAPHRTDIYDKMETMLQLPRGELAKLANLQRQEAWQGKLGEPPTPLFQDVRALRQFHDERRVGERWAKIDVEEFQRSLDRQKLRKLIEVVGRAAGE